MIFAAILPFMRWFHCLKRNYQGQLNIQLPLVSISSIAGSLLKLQGLSTEIAIASVKRALMASPTFRVSKA